MTREFNKQQRYGSRPSFRPINPNPNMPSNSYGEEQSPRPTARPRLNREIVDRAWENGAANRHPDYRPRTPQGQAPRQPWQKQQYGAHTSNQGSSNRPYNNNRQEYSQKPAPYVRSNDREQGRAPQSYNNYKGRSDQPGYQRSNPSYSPDTGRYQGNRSNYADQPQTPQGRGQNFRTQDQQRGRPEGSRYQDNPRSSNYGQDRPGYGYSGNQGRNGPYGQQEPRSFQNRPAPYRAHNDRGLDYRQRDQQFPARQQGGQYRERRDQAPYRQPYQSQYEGDYEHFAHDGPRDRKESTPYNRTPQQNSAPWKPQNRPASQEPERHVTRLPDGRVLKGPRPVQRRNARFWKEVSENTSSLIDPATTDAESQGQPHASRAVAEQGTPKTHVQASPSVKPEEKQPNVKREPARPQIVRRTERANPASASSSAKKPVRRIASAERRKKSVRVEKPPVLRPSQRGFKWPEA